MKDLDAIVGKFHTEVISEEEIAEVGDYVAKASEEQILGLWRRLAAPSSMTIDVVSTKNFKAVQFLTSEVIRINQPFIEGMKL